MKQYFVCNSGMNNSFAHRSSPMLLMKMKQGFLSGDFKCRINILLRGDALVQNLN